MVDPMVPLVRPWWMEMDIIVLGTVGCASVVFLLSAIIICYKAIKRLDVTFLSLLSPSSHRISVRPHSRESATYFNAMTN